MPNPSEARTSREAFSRVLARLGWSLLILVLGVSFSIYLHGRARHHTNESVRAKVLQHVDGVETKLRERLQAYESILYGAAGLFDATGEVTLSQWQAYGNSLRLLTRYPGFSALGYVALLSARDIPAHEAKLHRWGISEYKVRGDPSAGQLSAVTLLYPYTDTRSSFGLDILALGQEPRLAIELARDSGLVQLSPPLIPVAPSAP